jgi:hypothetical protein
MPENARFSPPGNLSDFNETLRQEWSDAVSVWFDDAIARQKDKLLDDDPCQYYNWLTTAPTGPTVNQAIVWNAFSGTQLRRWGRRNALIAADHMLALDQRWDSPGQLFGGGQWSNLFYRPQDEYCEWRVERNPDGRIQQVVFTAEPPEYYQALCGDVISGNGGTSVKFTGDQDTLVKLYREYVSEDVELDDLLFPVDVCGTGPKDPSYRAGQYNPYNKWNTTHGLMHLNHPSNTLQAEITLGADATVLWSDDQGRTVADPETLIARAGYGGANRCSDPTIGASVNQLAALGYGITLDDPVGLYMDHLDMTGWTIGDGDQPVDPGWFEVKRGKPGMIERAVFTVPASEGTVSDVRIAGEPICYGGQLAERMTVKLVGVADIGATFRNRPAHFLLQAYVEPANRSMVRSADVGSDLHIGAIPVSNYPESVIGASAMAPAAAHTARPRLPRPPHWSRAL